MVENNVVLHNAVFEVPNAQGRLMTQMTAQVFFVNAEARNALLVPVTALGRSENGTRVLVIDQNGQTEEIERGEFVAIVGASGCGKSTLMNILGCLDRPSTGQYWFDGQNVSKLSSDGLARLRRESFGFVFQSYNLLPGISASANVEMPASDASLRAIERQERAAKLLQRLGLGLDERMDHRPGGDAAAERPFRRRLHHHFDYPRQKHLSGPHPSITILLD